MENTMGERLERVTKAMRVRLKAACGDRELDELDAAYFEIAVESGALLMVLDAQQSIDGKPIRADHARAYADAFAAFKATLQALDIHNPDAAATLS
jgi:hypothetical protein